MKKICLSIMAIILLSGLVQAASYEKSVIKLIKKNPGLSPEIVEALKDCQLVQGMTEEQAILVGKRWNKAGIGLRLLGVYDPSIEKTTIIDEQGQKLRKLTFKRKTDSVTEYGEGSDHSLKSRTIEGETRIFLVLYLSDGLLTKWETAGKVGELKDETRAKIRREIEKGLGK